MVCAAFLTFRYITEFLIALTITFVHPWHISFLRATLPLCFVLHAVCVLMCGASLTVKGGTRCLRCQRFTWVFVFVFKFVFLLKFLFVFVFVFSVTIRSRSVVRQSVSESGYR